MSSVATAPPAANGLAQAGCVVLAPAPAPASTPAALPDFARVWAAERGLRRLVVHDPLSALAALCLLERAQLARAAWGLQRIDSIGLLILERDQWADLPRLVAVVHRYLPSIAIHELDDQAIASVLQTAESVAPRPEENCDDSRHVFSFEKGASLPATTFVETPRSRTAIPHGLPEQFTVASLPAPSPREALAASSSAAAARWPNDAAPSEAPPDPDEPLRITRDEIAMLLDEHFENDTP